MHRKVGIIGSGIAGLMCAHTLKEVGIECFILDKGRGPGGRMATRYREDWKWDHGAQYFTVRKPRFQSLVSKWQDLGVVQKWFDRPGDRSEGRTRYIGSGGINAMAQYLQKSLDVFQNTRVDCLHYRENIWHLETEQGNLFTCEECVCTQPIPQAVQLIKDSHLWDALRAPGALDSVEYEKGLSTLVVLSGGSGIPHPGCVKLNGDVLSWLADNSQKGLESSHTCVTLQAHPDFAKAYWEHPDSVRGALMIEAAKDFLASEVIDFHCHRWGFAFAKNPLSDTHYRDPSKKFSLAGDGFVQSRVESAMHSGVSAAEAIIESIK